MSEYIVPIVCCWACFFAGVVARQFSLKPLKKEIDRLFDGWNQSESRWTAYDARVQSELQDSHQECKELKEERDRAHAVMRAINDKAMLKGSVSVDEICFIIGDVIRLENTTSKSMK